MDAEAGEGAAGGFRFPRHDVVGLEQRDLVARQERIGQQA
jgi:hypothetical protein